MSEKTLAALGTYLRALIACILTAMSALGKSPFEYSRADVLSVLDSAWFAFLPVLFRALNPNDKTYGITRGE